MLLGNPNIDEPSEIPLEQVQSGAGGHAGGHGHDPAVEASQLDELAREVIGVVGRPLRCGGSGELGRVPMSADPADALPLPAGSIGASSTPPGCGMALSLRASAAPVRPALEWTSGVGRASGSPGIGGRAAP